MNKEQEDKIKKAILKMAPSIYAHAECNNIHCKHESSFRRNINTFDWVLPKRCPLCNSEWEIKEIISGE